MHFIWWSALFALISLSSALFRLSPTHVPVIPGNGIGRSPTSTQFAFSSSSIQKKSAVSVSTADPHFSASDLKRSHTEVQSSKTLVSSAIPLQMPPQTLQNNPPDIDFATTAEQEIHVLINAERTSQGLPDLSLAPMLARIARSHSKDMIDRNYFDHTDPSDCTFSCRMKQSDYPYASIDENIYTMTGYALDAHAIAKRVVLGWMQSPGHRANILDAQFTEEGIGISVSGTTVMATEILGLAK